MTANLCLVSIQLCENFSFNFSSEVILLALFVSNYQPLLLSRRSDLVRGSCRLLAGPSKNSLLNRGLTIGMQTNSNLQQNTENTDDMISYNIEILKCVWCICI